MSTRIPDPGNAPDPRRLTEMAWGYAAPVIVGTAVRLGLFAALERGPATLDELTAATGCSRRGLRILLQALVGLELLRRREDRFELTAESGAFLVPGKPGYRGGFFLHHLEHLLPRWLRLPEVVRTGRPVPRDRRPAEEFARFVEALFAGNLPAAQALQAHLGLRQTAAPCRVLDLGAGSGVWGIGLAEGAPQVRVTAVDWPEVLAVARRLAAEHGVAERFRWIEGDFFDVGLGNDYDLVVLGHILHSEGIERVRRLLERSHEALRPGGRVVIAEFLPADDRSGPLQPLLFAVNMLVNTEAGDTYTLAELTAWLEEAGFEAVETLPVPAVSPLVLARKPAR